MAALRAVVVGGGLGAPTVMAGLRAHTDDITGLIAVTDSGRSTGTVRTAVGMPAPGDIRSALSVLAEGDPDLRRLFGHRFETEPSDELDGMAFGNLFLAALTQQEGSFLKAVQVASRLLGLRGRVLPVTLCDTQLCARLADGSVVEGEVQVRGLGKAAIRELYFRDRGVSATEGTVEALRAAELIVIGPGSLYTTLCACLLVPEIARAIATSDAPVVYLANTTQQPGQSDGLSLADHVRVIQELLGGGGLDVVLVNSDPAPERLRAHYAAQGLHELALGTTERTQIAALGVECVEAPLIDRWSGPRDLWQKQDTIRHDPERTAQALIRLLPAAARPRLRVLA